MRVVQVGFLAHPSERDPEKVLKEWRNLPEIAAGAAAEGSKVALVVASRIDAAFGLAAVEVRFVADPLRALPLRLVEMVRSFGPHVVHVHGLSFARQTSWLSARIPRARIFGQDHADKPARGLRRPIQRWSFGRFAGVSFTSREQARPFVDAGLLKPHTPVFEVIEGSSPFSPGDREEARRATGLHGDPCVLWVGNLDESKDPMTALDAVRRAAGLRPGLELWCCYRRAPLLDDVRARIASEPFLAARVHLLGAREPADLEAFQRAADLFLSTSRAESTGYAGVEALACGTPPILSDIPSFRRLTAGGRVGALCAVGDARAFAAALSSWPTADHAREERRRAAREQFEADLSFTAQRRQLMSAYRAVLTRDKIRSNA